MSVQIIVDLEERAEVAVKKAVTRWSGRIHAQDGYYRRGLGQQTFTVATCPEELLKELRSAKFQTLGVRGAHVIDNKETQGGDNELCMA